MDALGETQSWPDAVSAKIKTVIRDYINRRQFDDVIVPRDHNKDPRKEIGESAYHITEKGLQSIGTVLRWWDPGEFQRNDDVEDQHFENWSMDLKREVKVNKAYGDAQKFAYEELGRAEAEAELLMSIIHSLDGIDFSANKSRTLQNLILMRTAQVIKALTTPDTQNKPPEENSFDRSVEHNRQ